MSGAHEMLQASPCSMGSSVGLLAGVSDFLTWRVVAAILSVMAALGYFVDNYWFNAKERDQFHTRLVRLWDRLDEIKVGDYHWRVAGAALRLGSSLAARGTGRTIAIAFGGSWLVTTIAFQVGTWNCPAQRWHDNFPFIDAYLVNLVFDVATLCLTLFGLRMMRQSRPLKAVVLGAAVVVVAGVLAIASVAGMLVGHNMLDRHFGQVLSHVGFGPDDCGFFSVLAARRQDVRTPNNEVVHLEKRPLSFPTIFRETALSYWSVLSRQEIQFEVPILFKDQQGQEWSVSYRGPVPIVKYELLYGATTLIPVVTFALVLFVLAVARVFSLAVKAVGLKLLERATETDPHKPNSFLPGTRLGVLFGLLAVIAKAVADVYR